MEDWLKFHFKKNLNKIPPPNLLDQKDEIFPKKTRDKNHWTSYCPLWKFIVWQLKCWWLKLWQWKNLWPQKGGDWNFGNKKSSDFGDEKFVMIEKGGDWKCWWPKLWWLKILWLLKVVTIEKGDDQKILIVVTKCHFDPHRVYGNQNGSNFGCFYPCLG